MPSSVVVELPRTLALKDIARSGLKEKDFKRLKLEALTADETSRITNGKYRARAVKFPYFSPTGRASDFYRLRFLDEVKRLGRPEKQQKLLRYWQPPDSETAVYFTPGVEWSKTLSDPNVEIWITEGEKKAAAACLAGIPCLGLGGVWNWRSSRNRQPLIPDLMSIMWKSRRVKICFDTEADPNPLVAGALEALGHALELRGAFVGVVTLPLLDDADKTGIDDYLVAKSVKQLLAIECITLASGAELIKLNDELIVIEKPSSVFHLPTKQLFSSPKPLVDILYPHRRVSGMDSAGRLTEFSAVTEWLKWPRHRTAKGLSFEPGEPMILSDGNLNLWNGWPFKPKKGSVTLLTKLIDYQFANAKPEHKKWFIQWLAYPIQNPGVKLYTSVVLWSKDTGTGKSLLGYTIGRVYGETFGVVTEEKLHSGFNAWQANKCLILGEEISGSDKRTEADRLKHMITGETIDINAKYQPAYKVRNTTNFIFTSNHHDAFLLDDRDRRQFIHEVGVDAQKPPVSWFTDTYDAWYKSDDGAAAIMYWLLNIDLKGFDPRAPAPETEARAAMVSVSGSESDYLIRDLLASPDVYLRMGDTVIKRALFTVDELIGILDPEKRYHLSHIGISKALRRAGVPGPLPTRTDKGTQKLWPVRDVDKWAKVDHQVRAQEYNGSMIVTADKPKPTREKF